MKKNLLSLLFLAFGPCAFAQTLNFVNKADMLSPRGGFATATYGGDAYIANGFAPSVPYGSQIEKYNFLSNSWSALATSPATIAKRYGNAQILSNTLYLFNGITETGLNNKLEVVELSTGNVSVLPDLNPQPVFNAGSALWGDYLLSFGGCVSQWTGVYSNKFYKIAPWGEWTELADMPVALETKGAVVYGGNNGNGKLYAFGGYSQTDGLHENFETVATTGNLALDNWLNIAEAGTKYFQGKTFASNKYAQITAFPATAQENSSISWLISPTLPFTATDHTYLTFDTNDGFDNGATLQAYLIVNWTGDIATSTKILLNANISSGHTSGYGTNFTNSGPVSLGLNQGSLRIAFKYSGGFNPLATTTFQIDNVKVYSEYKSNNVYVYDFATNTWDTQWEALPQGITAHDIALSDPFETDAKIYVSGDYDNQTFLGSYHTGNGTFTAIQQTNMIGRRHHGSALFDNKLFIFGGNTNPSTSSSLNSTQSADLSSLNDTVFHATKAIPFYPNPAVNQINLKADVKSIALFTLDGKSIATSIQNNQMDVSSLTQGIYLVQGFYADGSNFTEKLIKN